MTKVQKKKENTIKSAVEQGQADAKINAAKEREENTVVETASREEIIEQGRETARENLKAEAKEQPSSEDTSSQKESK